MRWFTRLIAELLPGWRMPTIPQKELRDNVADVLRRADAGDEFTITVARRPVAQLGPAQRRRWLRGANVARVCQAPAPETLIDDLERVPRRAL